MISVEQVMAQEVSSGLKIAKEEGINELMRFSPSEMRNLLHHIMAGFEFQIMKRGETAEGIGYRVVIEDKVISKVSNHGITNLDSVEAQNCFPELFGTIAPGINSSTTAGNLERRGEAYML